MAEKRKLRVDERAKRMRNRILNGPIERTLLALAGPLIVNNLVQVVYNITDTFWLGRLGRKALSAPGVTWPIIGTLMAFGMGFAMAGFSLVGQYVGAGRYERAERSAGALYSMMIFFSSVSMAIGLLLLPPALRFMKVSPGVYPYALTYARIVFMGVPFSFLAMTFGALVRAVGDTRTPVKINVLTVLINVVLDPILIFGLIGLPRLGVAGAATATLISSVVGALLGAYLLFSGRVSLRLRLSDLKPDWEFYGRIFRVGLPSSVGQSANSFGFILLTRIIFGFGDVTYAAYIITTRLVNFITSISRGISMAMGTMIAQNIGAENYGRAKRIAERTMLINLAIASFAVLIIGVFRVPIFRVFLNDPKVIKESAIVMKYFLISVPAFNGILMVVNRTFSSAGHTKKSMTVSMFRLWGLRLPLSYIFGYVSSVTILGVTIPLASLFGMSSRGVFFGMGLSNFIAAAVALAWFMRGTWMKRIIEGG